MRCDASSRSTFLVLRGMRLDRISCVYPYLHSYLHLFASIFASIFESIVSFIFSLLFRCRWFRKLPCANYDCVMMTLESNSILLVILCLKHVEWRWVNSWMKRWMLWILWILHMFSVFILKAECLILKIFSFSCQV